MSKFSAHISKIVVLDCRFEYEHSGGHIPGAINCVHKEQLNNLYFDLRKNQSENMVVVLHCEYSKHRAPKVWKFFRELDRNNNVYPKLSFPNLFVLDGGYRNFHQEFSSRCENGYISMFDKQFQEECKVAFKRFRKSWSKSRRRHQENEEDMEIDLQDDDLDFESPIF